jgi:hypothetical protein
LLVDLVNNLKELAEDRDKVLGQVAKKAASMDTRALSGAVAAKKFFARALADDRLKHAAR